MCKLILFILSIMVKICGVKTSICGIVFGVWGFIQLGIMGILYYVKSVPLGGFVPGLDDVEFSSPEEFYTAAEFGYTQTAYHCWIAALFYLLLASLSLYQFWVNYRRLSRD